MPPLMIGLTNLPKLGGVPPGPHGSDYPAQATTMSTLEINDASRSLGLCLSIAKEYISTYLECQDFQIDSYLSFMPCIINFQICRYLFVETICFSE